jgi:hypothetical protein
MEELFYSELSIVQETKKLLEEFGNAEILYITAEFAPFSNQRRPDLQFTPKDSDDKIFFIEYKFKPANGFDESYFKSILEHREFVQEDTDIEVKYAFATTARIDKKFEQFLIDNNIEVFNKIRSAKELFDSIIEWANPKY